VRGAHGASGGLRPGFILLVCHGRRMVLACAAGLSGTNGTVTEWYSERGRGLPCDWVESLECGRIRIQEPAWCVSV
jgi:hypothetical protein